MSEVAGCLSIQMGMRFLEKTNGGSGVLLGGVPGVAPGTVAVLGAGNVGLNATRTVRHPHAGCWASWHQCALDGSVVLRQARDPDQRSAITMLIISIAIML